MSYDFHSYIADLVLASQKSRNTGSHSSAAELDDQMHFAINDAAKNNQLGDPEEFRQNVAHKVIERGGSDLIDTLIPQKK